MKKNDFINYIYFKPLDKSIKGFLSKENIESLRENTITGTVFPGMEYRPDKLSAYYLGDERFGWILDITNEFYNGIKDYYLGREIKIPTDSAIENLKFD